METLRLNGDLYIILTGSVKETHVQALTIHKYSPESNKIEKIHQALLGNVPLKVWAYNAKSWTQNGSFIYYFEIENKFEEE